MTRRRKTVSALLRPFNATDRVWRRRPRPTPSRCKTPLMGLVRLPCHVMLSVTPPSYRPPSETTALGSCNTTMRHRRHTPSVPLQEPCCCATRRRDVVATPYLSHCNCPVVATPYARSSLKCAQFSGRYQGRMQSSPTISTKFVQ